jgi:hypothetical protein
MAASELVLAAGRPAVAASSASAVVGAARAAAAAPAPSPRARVSARPRNQRLVGSASFARPRVDQL